MNEIPALILIVLLIITLTVMPPQPQLRHAVVVGILAAAIIIYINLTGVLHV